MNIQFYLRNGTPAEIRSPHELEAESILQMRRNLAEETEFFGLTSEECAAMTRHGMLTYICKMNGSSDAVILCCFVNNHPVGVCELWFKSRACERHRATIAIAICKDYWDQGIATHLMDEAFQIAAERTGLRQIELQVVDTNSRAIAFCRKVGFRKVGSVPSAVLLPDGSYHKRHIMIYSVR